MPVALNEPLTFLQKLVEYIEYAGLLHAAAAASDPLDRLAVCKFFILYFTIPLALGYEKKIYSLHQWPMI